MRSLLLITLFHLVLGTNLNAQTVVPLATVSKISLGGVKGRLDHMAFDIDRHRLYVAELGNNSVAVVDLMTHKVIHRIVGFNEPQGIVYVFVTDSLFITNGGDGSVRIFNAVNFKLSGTIDLGSDADNIRYDQSANRLYIGYGNGGLAVIDPVTRRVLATISLKAHPESFQLDTQSSRIFVNVPGAHEIAVVDRVLNAQVGSWPLNELRGNFPMALDEVHQQAFVAFRQPATLAQYSAIDGSVLWSAKTCVDADDVFLDSLRARVYVSCGEGRVETYESSHGSYHRLDTLLTSRGARASLYVPQLDRLFIAANSSDFSDATVWELRPISAEAVH